MGFFNKTEDEIKLEAEKKNLKELKDAIRSSRNIAALDQKEIADYIDNIINGGVNQFYDADFLVRALVSLDGMNYIGHSAMYYVNEYVRALREFLPYGDKTQGYEEIKEFFISHITGEFGYINKGIYDNDLVGILGNLDDYARVMNVISRNPKAIANLIQVKNYIKESAKYVTSNEVYIQSLLSTISKLDDGVLNVEEYFANEIDKDKKRAGIYSVSHDDIRTASVALNRFNSYLEKLEHDMTIIDEKEDDIQKTLSESLVELEHAKELQLKELRDARYGLEKEAKRIIENHSQNAKLEIDSKADVIFAELLDKYQEQLEEFKRASINLKTTNTKELTYIRNESEKQLSKLRDFVDKNSEFKSCLDEAEKSSVFRDKILELMEKEAQAAEMPTPKKAVIVEGIDRMVVPAAPDIAIPPSIEIPDNIEIIPTYSFKNAKEYAEILKRAERIIKENESNGAIYHKKVLEIMECLMVGDWPYMFGPTGAGKGYIIKQIGDLLGQNVIDGGKIGDVHTVLGYIDPQGRFRATPAVEACVHGDLIFFDEFDNGNPDTRVALNTMYSNLRDKIQDPSSQQYIKFAGEIDVPINPNMRMIAAGNTDGTGSDELFTDRYPTDESIKERYKPIYVAYDNRVEKHVLRKYEAWYDFFADFRAACEEYAKSQGMQAAPGNASTRDAADINRDVSLNAKTMEEMMNQYFVQTKEDDYRFTIGKKIAQKYGLTYEDTYVDYDRNLTLADAKSKDIAKQFIMRCKKGIKE